MARFYGTVRGKAESPASREGTSHSGLDIVAMSQSYHIRVMLRAAHADVSTDYVTITIIPHPGGEGFELYSGPIRDLYTKDGQHAIVRRFAEQQLREEHS